MKKIITTIFLCLLLIGCQSNTNEIDETSFNYEASYGGLDHSMGAIKKVAVNETGFYQIVYFKSRSESNVENYLISYTSDTKKQSSLTMTQVILVL